MMKISIHRCTKCGEVGECRAGHKQCRECEKAYSKTYYAKNKEIFSDYREVNRPRVKCGDLEA
jgi:hypothetical protein